MRTKSIRLGTEGEPPAEPIVDTTLNTVESQLARAAKILGDGVGLIEADYTRVYDRNVYEVGDIIQINDDLGGWSGFAMIVSITPRQEVSSDGALKTTLQFGIWRMPYESD